MKTIARAGIVVIALVSTAGTIDSGELFYDLYIPADMEVVCR